MEFLALQKTSIWKALSPLGRRIETPQGIFYWSARAKQEAEIDGTIGVAQDDDGTISHLAVAEPWAGEAISARLPKGKVFGYAPIAGMESLRKKWHARLLEKHPSLAANALLPVVANGITHSLAIVGRLFLAPGDVLLTAEKSWENYAHIYEDMQGVRIQTFALFNEAGGLNIEGILEACREQAEKNGKVVLLLNFPHNQTGFMPRAEESKALGRGLTELARAKSKVPFAVLLDDAYEGYVYDGASPDFSMLSDIFAPLPNFCAVKLDGISKVMLAYGYRVGFVTLVGNPVEGAAFSEKFLQDASAQAASKIGGVIRAEISQVNHHGQALADALLEEPERLQQERGEVIARLKARWRAMMEAFERGFEKYGKEKMRLDPCNGGFFGYVTLARGLDPHSVAERLLKECKVGVVPSGNGLRVAFCAVPQAKIARMVEAVFETVYL